MTDLLAFVHRCESAGFDLVHPFNVDWFQASAPPSEHLVDFGRRNALGLLVANSRRLWRYFPPALALDADLRREADPLDRYTERTLEAARALLPCASFAAYAHRRAPSPIPIQRIAERVGFAAIGPAHLSVHALLGPWVAFRAVVTVDAPGPPGEPPHLARPCDSCDAPCVRALERAVRLSSSSRDSDRVRGQWRSWLAVRDACPVGTDHRYPTDQIEYHYAGRGS